MLRPTASRVPHDAATQSQTALPLGALVTPLAPSPPPRSVDSANSTLSPRERDEFIASAATTSEAIPRCAQCAAYISVRSEMNARYWRCCMCSKRNALPSRYTPALLAAPEAIDLVPELSRDVYDVPLDDAPVPPTAYIFLLDTNGDHMYLDTARQGLRNALEAIEGHTTVGVALYSDNLSFLDARSQGLLRTVSALDIDVPISQVFPSDQWLRPTNADTREAIMRVLSRLTPSSHLHDPDHTTHRALGPAVRAALDMIEAAELLASRIVVIAAGEPNCGDGAIQISGETTTPKDRFPTPVTPFFVDQGARASLLGAMIDCYIVSRMPVDVASISPLAQTTGGSLILYETAESSLAQDVWQHLNDPAVVRGMLRIRTSAQLAVSDVYGCGVYRDMEVENVFRLSCHGHTSTLAAELAYTDEQGFTAKDAGKPCIQVAFRGVFLEPGALPQRVLRVETQVYPVSSSRAAIHRDADPNAVAGLLFHKAIATADEQGIAEARMLLFDWLANLIANTAIESSNEDHDGIVDPTLQKYPTLRTIPRLVFGLIRSFLFRQEAVAPDARAALRCIWEDLSPELLAAAAYPRLSSFLNLEEKSIKELPLSITSVKQSGHPIFMLDAFSEVVIYYATPGRRDLPFPPKESSLVMRVRAACIRDRPVTPKCVVCREGTPKDRWFKSYLIEDAVPGAAAQSFSAFMQGIADAAEEILSDTKA